MRAAGVRSHFNRVSSLRGPRCFFGQYVHKINARFPKQRTNKRQGATMASKIPRRLLVRFLLLASDIVEPIVL